MSSFKLSEAEESILRDMPSWLKKPGLEMSINSEEASLSYPLFPQLSGMEDARRVYLLSAPTQPVGSLKVRLDLKNGLFSIWRCGDTDWMVEFVHSYSTSTWFSGPEPALDHPVARAFIDLFDH